MYLPDEIFEIDATRVLHVMERNNGCLDVETAKVIAGGKRAPSAIKQIQDKVDTAGWDNNEGKLYTTKQGAAKPIREPIINFLEQFPPNGFIESLPEDDDSVEIRLYEVVARAHGYLLETNIVQKLTPIEWVSHLQKLVDFALSVPQPNYYVASMAASWPYVKSSIEVGFALHFLDTCKSSKEAKEFAETFTQAWYFGWAARRNEELNAEHATDDDTKGDSDAETA